MTLGRTSRLPAVDGPLVVETAGGLMVLTREWMQIDQLQQWQLPVVLVARSGWARSITPC